MKGDFARISFDPRQHFSRVLQQQGRVLLEADWNEQHSIHLHLLRSLIVDLVGRCWAAGDGFGLLSTNANGGPAPLKDWRLTPGHFYVDGLLCENDEECTLAAQPYRPSPDSDASGNSGLDNPPDRFVLYLDAWERHVSAVEAPALLDVALEGVDTASRAQVAWHIRMLDLDTAVDMLEQTIEALHLRDDLPPFAQELLEPDFDPRQALEELFDSIGRNEDGSADDDACHGLRILLTLRNQFAFPRLKASLGAIDTQDDPCLIAPDARYRGCENQLYRVEIHDGGLASDGETRRATFKWSRENGSVIFPIIAAPVSTGMPAAGGGTDYSLQLAHLGRDDRLGLGVHDWVELCDRNVLLAQRVRPLLQVVAVDAANRRVTVHVPATLPGHVPSVDMDQRPHLRRWDQRAEVGDDGTLAVSEGDDGIELEDGVMVAFMPGGLYAPGDYWTIPARTANQGQLDWPEDESQQPLALPAQGAHHYAALGGIDSDGEFVECSCRILPLCEQPRAIRRPAQRSARLLGGAPPGRTPAKKAATKRKPAKKARKPGK